MNVDMCRACGSASLTRVRGYDRLRRVTSDCKPWPAGGTLLICDDCGLVQKRTDAVWEAEMQEIYDGYAIYHQSGGEEQAVFEDASGGAARSSVLVRKLVEHFTLPSKGRLLDVGCGNGSLLRSFARLRPEWSLCGTELNDKYIESVERIDQVEMVHCGLPEGLPGEFDVITMVHVLEHIPEPNLFLEGVRSKLRKNGILVVQIPDHRMNPFDLLIADHCTHFTVRTLGRYLQSRAYNVRLLETRWIPKEMTAVVENRESDISQYAGLCDEGQITPMEEVTVCIEWLKQLLVQAKALAERGNFGIFGTSIAATWLASELGTGIDFFVDEDRNRVGKRFMGRPVFYPEDIPEESNVFVAMPSKLARNLCERLQVAGRKYNFSIPLIE